MQNAAEFLMKLSVTDMMIGSNSLARMKNGPYYQLIQLQQGMLSTTLSACTITQFCAPSAFFTGAYMVFFAIKLSAEDQVKYGKAGM